MKNLVHRKYLLPLLLFQSFLATVCAQNNRSDIKIAVRDIIFRKDTGFLKEEGYRMLFLINISQVETVNKLHLELIDGKDELVLDLDTYAVKKHETGFYYIETVNGEKSSVLNADMFFSKKLTLHQFENSKKLRIGLELKVNDPHVELITLPIKTLSN